MFVCIENFLKSEINICEQLRKTLNAIFSKKSNESFATKLDANFARTVKIFILMVEKVLK